jgi:hypothetical protein
MDQFYTKQEVAKECYQELKDQIDLDSFDTILEPSAGTGSFFQLIPEHQRMGIDLEPKYPGIVQQDFLQFHVEPNKRYCVVGNPPFGKVSSLAVKFFNHAATFADVIAFIIPRTFKRVSVQNRLHLNFHLMYNKDLPIKPCCFSPAMSAKCCFQIWSRGVEKRQRVILPTTHHDFEFLSLGPLDEKGQPTPPIGAHFVVKAYGSNCGSIKETDLNKLRPKSWHWIKSNIDVQELKKRFMSLNFSISKDTVRQDSIGQSELVQLYTLSLI